MPKAGIEPARGVAPLDFESSASTSSATSARSRAVIVSAGGCKGVEPGSVIAGTFNGARRVQRRNRNRAKEEEW